MNRPAYLSRLIQKRAAQTQPSTEEKPDEPGPAAAGCVDASGADPLLAFVLEFTDRIQETPEGARAVADFADAVARLAERTGEVLPSMLPRLMKLAVVR